MFPFLQFLGRNEEKIYDFFVHSDKNAKKSRRENGAKTHVLQMYLVIYLITLYAS